MLAKLVRTDGPGKAALLQIDGREHGVGDGFSWSAEHAPDIGDEFEVELSAEVDHSWSWEQMFAANPERRIGLVPLGGYAYRALGRILSVEPVRIDCGILVVEGAFHSRDSRVIGEFVGFRIEVLDAEG
jgi:hypothetical protein